MAKQGHPVLMAGGAVAAALAGYEFVYKPWKATQDAALATSSGLFAPTGGGGGGGGLPYVTTPTVLNPGNIQPSNLNPGAVVGGPTGTCMSRKMWPQQQCQTRLDALTQGYASIKSQLATLLSGADVTAMKATIVANQQALANAMAAYNTAIATNNPALANQLKIEIDGHNADIAALQAHVARVPTDITALQNTLAGLAHDYQALTGLTLA